MSDGADACDSVHTSSVACDVTLKRPEAVALGVTWGVAAMLEAKVEAL